MGKPPQTKFLYREVPKPHAMQMLELVRALQLMHDAIVQLRAGRIQYLVTLSGQLRALLTDRSKSSPPLLFRISKTHNKPLQIYCMPGVDNPNFPAGVRDKVIMHLAGFPLTPHRQDGRQRQLSFDGFLKEKILLYKGKTYTATEIIEWFANKAGGSHYSNKMPADFAELLSMNIGGLRPVANALVQIGDAALVCGRALLRDSVNLEIHAMVAVPQQDMPDTMYLFDGSYEKSNMRITMFLNKSRMPGIFVSGLQGSTVTVVSDRVIEWTDLRHLHASITIEDDLSTRVELAVDGERVGVAQIDEPLFVLNDITDYEYYHHRSVEGPEQRTTMGVGDALMTRALSPSKRANLFVYLEQSRKRTDLPIVAYAPGAYAHAPKGTTNLQMSGTVRRVSALEYLSNSVPKEE